MITFRTITTLSCQNAGLVHSSNVNKLKQTNCELQITTKEYLASFHLRARAQPADEKGDCVPHITYKQNGKRIRKCLKDLTMSYAT